GLDDEEPVAREKPRAMPEGGHRIRKMLKHVVQHDDVEAAWLERLGLDGAREHPDAEGIVGELRHLGAQLCTDGLVPGPAEKGHVAPVGATDLEHASRWN